MPSWILRLVDLVRTEVSEKRVAPMEVIPSSDTSVLTQEPHGVTSQKPAFFIVTAVKNSNLT
jgi:hypothetical protein